MSKAVVCLIKPVNTGIVTDPNRMSGVFKDSRNKIARQRVFVIVRMLKFYGADTIK
ncbi:MAG: hypothetical protein WDM78_20520 [Puia sp.]